MAGGPDLLGATKVLQPVKSEVSEGGARRQPVADEAGCCCREQYLTPAGNGRNASGALHLKTIEAGHVFRRLTEVDAHPHAELLTSRPLMCAKTPLHLDHR